MIQCRHGGGNTFYVVLQAYSYAFPSQNKDTLWRVFCFKSISSGRHATTPETIRYLILKTANYLKDTNNTLVMLNQECLPSHKIDFRLTIYQIGLTEMQLV